MYPKYLCSWPIAQGAEPIKFQMRIQAMSFMFQPSMQALCVKGGIPIAASVSKYPGSGLNLALQEEILEAQ